MTFKKILIITIVLLTSIIIGEIYYLNNQSTEIDTTTTTVQVPTSTEKIPLPTDDTQIADELVKSYRKTIGHRNADILKKSIRSDIYETTIKEIEYEEGKTNIFEYIFKLTLNYKENEDFIIHFNQNDLNKTSVFELVDNQPVPYDLSLLKPGDKIRLELDTNLFEYFDRNTEAIKITKLNK